MNIPKPWIHKEVYQNSATGNPYIVYDYSITGHEYGHFLLLWLKPMAYTTNLANVTPSTDFTEAMADLVGVISNYQLHVERHQVGAFFQLGRITWTDSNTYNLRSPLVISWELRRGRCPAAPMAVRERVGHAFYRSYQLFGYEVPNERPSRPEAHLEHFRVWWTVIFSVFRDLPFYPDQRDFVARLETMAYSNSEFLARTISA